MRPFAWGSLLVIALFSTASAEGAARSDILLPGPIGPQPPAKFDSLGRTEFSFGDHLWTPGFGLPGVDGDVHCAIRFKGDLVIGGLFRSVGGTAANNIARWDGERWYPLADGIEGDVTALVEYDGDLYAAGTFQYVDDSLSLHLARWDGSRWEPFGIGGSYYCCYDVRSLAIYRGDLLVGGQFSPNETDLHGILRWDGEYWSEFAGGVDGRVNRLVVDGDKVYVAGLFATAGGVPATNVAMWDGSSWTALGGGVPSIDSYSDPIWTMAAFQGRLYVGGYFLEAGGSPISNLAAWDGASWDSIPGVQPPAVSALVVHEGALLIAGYDLIYRWDGVSMTAPFPGILGSVNTLLSGPEGIAAVGDFWLTDGSIWESRGFKMAEWVGSEWQALEPWDGSMNGLASYDGSPATILCLQPYRGELVAGGYMQFAGDGHHWKRLDGLGLASWSGSEWANVATDSLTGYPSPLALYAEGDTLLAAGHFAKYQDGTYQEYPVFRVVGAQREALDTLSFEATCIMPYQGDIVIGTRRPHIDGPYAGVYAYQGGWKLLGAVDGAYPQFSSIRCLGSLAGELLVGGDFSSIGGVAAEGIAAWNGARWHGFPDLDAQWEIWVQAFANFKGKPVAGGYFRSSSGACPVIMWDGSAWRPIDGIAGVAERMAVIRDRLFVFGSLKLDGGVSRRQVVMYDGVRWESLGSGVNGAITSMAEFDGSLFVAGYFSRAGRRSAFSIARWNGMGPIQGPAPWLSEARPNPTRGSSELTFRLRETGDIRVSVFDMRGREVVLLENGSQSAGKHVARWDGRDRSGRPAPAGVYFLSVQTKAGVRTTKKIVRVR